MTGRQAHRQAVAAYRCWWSHKAGPPRSTLPPGRPGRGARPRAGERAPSLPHPDGERGRDRETDGETEERRGSKTRGRKGDWNSEETGGEREEEVRRRR